MITAEVMSPARVDARCEAQEDERPAAPDFPDATPPSRPQVALAPHEIAATFLESSRALNVEERDLLAHQGVAPEALERDPFLLGSSPVLVARVAPTGCFFDFASNHDDTQARWALVLLARDEDGFVRDIAAFDLAGWQARWLGAVPILGGHHIERPRLAQRVPCFETVADWLKARRNGVAILDHRRARWRLADVSLSTTSADCACRLRRALTIPPPNIKIERAQ